MLKRLHASQEKEWRRRATETDMAMLLAIEDTNWRNDLLTHFVELHEMDKKGSPVQPKIHRRADWLDEGRLPARVQGLGPARHPDRAGAQVERRLMPAMDDS